MKPTSVVIGATLCERVNRRAGTPLRFSVNGGMAMKALALEMLLSAGVRPSEFVRIGTRGARRSVRAGFLAVFEARKIMLRLAA